MCVQVAVALQLQHHSAQRYALPFHRLIQWLACGPVQPLEQNGPEIGVSIDESHAAAPGEMTQRGNFSGQFAVGNGGGQLHCHRPMQRT